LTQSELAKSWQLPTGFYNGHVFNHTHYDTLQFPLLSDVERLIIAPWAKMATECEHTYSTAVRKIKALVTANHERILRAGL
jgi:hypothetical protein